MDHPAAKPAYPVAVLFDLDGTLIDTMQDLADAIDAMRADMELPPLGARVVETYVGKGVPSLVERSLAHGGHPTTTAMTARGLERFREHYRAGNGAHAAPYPGVVEGLRRWRGVARGLAVVTNKSREFTLPLLDSMGLAQFFDAVVCGDTCPRRKPDPDPVLYACRQLGAPPVDALMIGDSINDALAARSAGVVALAVPYGYHAEAGVDLLPVAGVVPSIAAAVDWAAQNWWRVHAGAKAAP